MCFDFLRPKDKSKKYKKPLVKAPTPEPEDIFWIPDGSRDICLWCKKLEECNPYGNEDYMNIRYHGMPVKVKIKDFHRMSQVCGCQGFIVDETKVPKGKVGKLR